MKKKKKRIFFSLVAGKTFGHKSEKGRNAFLKDHKGKKSSRKGFW
jgi:hypothetical protein